MIMDHIGHVFITRQKIQTLNKCRVSFQKWLENVLLASTRGTNQKTVREIIDMIHSGKGGGKMIHGIQVIIQGEYNRGIAEGKARILTSMICKKLAKGKSPEVIAEELEEELAVIAPVIEAAQKYAPDYDEELICQELAAREAMENDPEAED